MTIKHWMLLAALLAGGSFSTALLGQTATPVPADPPPPPLIPANEPPPTPAPTTPAPKKADKKADKKTTAKKTPATKSGAKDAAKPSAKADTTKTPSRTIGDLKPGLAVAMERNVNVRGKAAINSEIVTHLKRGDLVTVLEQVSTKPGPDEPAKWAKISLPAGSAAWVNASFIDDASKTVKPKLLNLRSGPGENFSVLGRVDKGTVIKVVEHKGEWIKIEAPTNAYAFAAAHLFSQEAAVIAAAEAKSTPAATVAAAPTPPPEKPIETVAVTTTPAVVPADNVVTPPPTTPPTVPAPTPAPESTPTTPAPANNVVAVAPEPPAPAPSPAPIPAKDAEPLIKRIVTREGIVRGSASIQAPTYFVLRSLDNNKTINYLHTIDTNIVIRSFQHQRVMVVGEEILDERWPNTPVIDVDSIQSVP